MNTTCCCIGSMINGLCAAVREYTQILRTDERPVAITRIALQHLAMTRPTTSPVEAMIRTLGEASEVTRAFGSELRLAAAGIFRNSERNEPGQNIDVMAAIAQNGILG